MLPIGPYDAAFDSILIRAVNVTDLSSWLTATSLLEYRVLGSAVKFVPYYTIQDELFEAYPCFLQ